MNGFKLLGIKTKDRVVPTGKNNVTDYLKILKENTYYSFYSSYKYDEQNNTFKYHPELDSDIYNVLADEVNQRTNDLKINVSAIVGGNGSGKSTLIELLFLAIHNLSVACKVLKDPDTGGDWSTEMNVKLDLFYTLDQTIYCVRLNDFDISISSIIPISNKIYGNFQKFLPIRFSDLNLFFYSIAINYSLYGLNTNHTGDWIRALFHKNDAYQTPIVINPMRDEGNIKINREEYLSKSRLLSNLLIKSDSTSHLELTKKQRAVDLRFTLNSEKIENLFNDKRPLKPIVWTFEQFYKDHSNEEDFLNLIYLHLIELNRKEVDVPFKYEIERYIVKKLFKIARTYDRYTKYMNNLDNVFDSPHSFMSFNEEYQPRFYSDKDKNIVTFITELKKDNSHITFKLNQAINYIKKNPLRNKGRIKWTNDTKQFQISIEELSTRISAENSSEIVNYIPPSLFDIEIYLEEIEDNTKRCKFESLSSGEQQHIQSIQTILYHITNLNSVFSNNNREDIKYKSINLLLDEIELYFNPEFQRLFVSSLIESISKLKINKIDNINILFSTHSPFILSDIQSQNVLHLKVGEAIPKDPKNQTFGANIHDLLANDFFLDNGFIGEFAKNYIQKLFDEIINLQTETAIILSEKGYILLSNKINLIGERIIRIRLEDLLNEIPREVSQVDIEIEKISKYLEELKLKRRNNAKD